ncbi:MAG: VRR-NUC domain-containing protein [Steroidobacteraceae bacterium]
MAGPQITSRIDRPASPRVLADPYYYLHNFEQVIASLDARYAALWSADERRFIVEFAALPRSSRGLLVRMVIRKGELFRASRLDYPEIGPTTAACAPLLESGWVEQQAALDIDELQRVFNKAELLRYFALPGLSRRFKKPELVAALRAQQKHPTSLQVWQQQSGDRVYRLCVGPVCDLFRQMFFGNFHQDWSEFVLADLGVFAYESVPPSLQSAAFQTRAQIDCFQRLGQCRQLLEDEQDPDLVCAQMPPAVEDSDWLEELRQKRLFQIAGAYERRGDCAAAVRIYSGCRHRGARLRAVRLRERTGDWTEARKLCLAAQGDPAGVAELEGSQRVLRRINRKLGILNNPTPSVPAKLPSFELAAATSSSQCTVEYLVRDRLASQSDADTTVHYVENSLVLSLFGLLCWKAIFLPIPGAFFHAFQHGPADLLSAAFYQRRRQMFAACFTELNSEQYQASMRRCFAEKRGVQSPFVAWGVLSGSLLDCALACIPASHLRLWFEWIIADLHENRAGFPDLVQFWPRQRRYRMIEVKGPGDRLQDNQRRLLEYCVAHQMPVSVCYVRDTVSNLETARPGM